MGCGSSTSAQVAADPSNGGPSSFDPSRGRPAAADRALRTGPSINVFSVLDPPLEGLSPDGKGPKTRVRFGGTQGGAPSEGGGGALGDGTESVPSDTAVKVAVAVRPLMDLERGCNDIVTIAPPGRITLPKKPDGSGTEDSYPFDFEKVIRINNLSASKELFGALVLPVVERFCQGFNATVAAYGQTGSGKTYTMGTSLSLQDFLAPDPVGVVPRVLAVLFSYIGAAAKTYDISLKVTYVEIYNEQVADLLSDEGVLMGGGGGGGALHPQVKVVRPMTGAAAEKKPEKSGLSVRMPTAGKLEIRENADGDVYVEGAKAVQVFSREDVAKVLDKGNAHRSTASHKMNAESSRSHAIVTISMEQRVKIQFSNSVPTDVRFLRSKLHLVDLAGSERAKETGATGDRFAEGVNINKGLLELGNVINALTEGKSRKHVPYRNSKLTRLLQDSLGGNSETLFIACISPADRNHDHTLNTLRYASRARAIRNNLRLNNKLSPEEEIEYLKGVIEHLQMENGNLKEKLNKAGMA